jgi:hypothetical protein
MYIDKWQTPKHIVKMCEYLVRLRGVHNDGDNNAVTAVTGARACEERHRV